MENIQQQDLPKNPLYHLAKQITLTKNDEEKEVLFEKLSQMLNSIFKTEKTDEIESALDLAAENDEGDILSIIMDDTEAEISNIEFTKNDVEYSSSMLVMPCMMITKKEEVVIPSIGTFQEAIRKYLLKEKLIDHADEFRLGAVRIDNSTIDDLSMNDWWAIHRNILNDYGTKENDEKLTHKHSHEVENGISLFHLIPVIVTEKSNETILDNVLTSEKMSEVLASISQELSSEGVGFHVMNPGFISESISDAQFVLQTSELSLLLKEYDKYENIEIAYRKTDEDGTYVIFFIDNEGDTLADFYIFETDGNETEMITMLIKEVQEFPTQKLWHFDEIIKVDDLDAWYEEETIDLTQMMKTAHAIDIRQYNHFVNTTSNKYLH